MTCLSSKLKYPFEEKAQIGQKIKLCGNISKESQNSICVKTSNFNGQENCFTLAGEMWLLGNVYFLEG